VNQEERSRGSESSESKSSASQATGAAPSEQAASGSNESDLERDLNEVRSKAASYLDLAQRTQADFLNYKRRIEQERGEYARSARADMLLKVLPAFDDLDLAVGSLPPDLAGNEWAQGVMHIDRKLRSTLDALGLKPIDAVGKPFDPWQEEAVGHEPSATVPAESVTRVLRSGYTLDGRVVRPAQVLVSSGPPETKG
jgi:molecular chaperone GrpE